MIDAKQTLNQLGGTGKLNMMVGACNFTKTDDAVSFKFKGSKSANHVRITLNGRDLYDVKFFKIRGVKVKTTAESKDVFADQLIDLFESETGLYLSL